MRISRARETTQTCEPTTRSAAHSRWRIPSVAQRRAFLTRSLSGSVMVLGVRRFRRHREAIYSSISSSCRNGRIARKRGWHPGGPAPSSPAENVCPSVRSRRWSRGSEPWESRNTTLSRLISCRMRMYLTHSAPDISCFFTRRAGTSGRGSRVHSVCPWRQDDEAFIEQRAERPERHVLGDAELGGKFADAEYDCCSLVNE